MVQQWILGDVSSKPFVYVMVLQTSETHQAVTCDLWVPFGILQIEKKKRITWGFLLTGNTIILGTFVASDKTDNGQATQPPEEI